MINAVQPLHSLQCRKSCNNGKWRALLPKELPPTCEMPFKSTRPVLKVLSKSFQTPLVHRIDVQGKVSVNTSVQLHVTCDRAQLLAALCHRPYILQRVIK